MSWLKNIWALSIIFICIFSTGLGIYYFNKPEKMNILILSACSLRADRIGLYGGLSKTPYLDKAATNSYVFNNAYAALSWSNVADFLSSLTISELQQDGYTAIGRPWSAEHFLPHTDYSKIAPFLIITPHPTSLIRPMPSTYRSDLAAIKVKILDRANWPFLIEVHNKMMHYPYGGEFYQKIRISNMISENSKAYIKDYSINYKKYPERLPLGMTFMETSVMLEEIISVFNLKNKAAKKVRISKDELHFVGVLNNKMILNNWQKSKYFARDLEVIKEMYDVRMNIFDESIKEILNFYDNSELAKNTVLIFTGDHGEGLFEHGYLVHGETVFDEMIRFPLFIKFPGQTASFKMDDQFFQQSIYKIIKKIMAGELNQTNFESFIKTAAASPFIFSRNCANDIKSLRYKNEWKLMQNLKTDKSYLFDLKNDPSELIDVHDKNPDMAVFLLEKISAVAATQVKNKLLDYCTEENN